MQTSTSNASTNYVNLPITMNTVLGGGFIRSLYQAMASYWCAGNINNGQFAVYAATTASAQYLPISMVARMICIGK